MINNDIQLRDWHPEKVAEYKSLIEEGRPYVWQLALSLDAYNELEVAINNSIDAHNGGYKHLISKEYALYVIIYFAEWYKRYYAGIDYVDTRKFSFAQLSYEEKKLLYDYAEIDTDTFVYTAVKNKLWKDSLHILGGLAVKAELSKSDDDPFLRNLCRLYHGEEVDITDDDYQRAVAFKKSIQEKHSLYHYVQFVLKCKPDAPYPFDITDIADPNSDFCRLIKKIANADKYVKKDKYELEWLVEYGNYNDSLTRQLRIGLKPEEIGGKYREYIFFDRLEYDWNISSPQSVRTIDVDLRFKDGSKTIRKATFEQPILTYDNAENAFLLRGNSESVIFSDVPIEHITEVDVMVRCDGKILPDPVQKLKVDDSLQLYLHYNTASRKVWSSKKNSQAQTMVIYNDSYHLAPESEGNEYRTLSFKRDDKESEPWYACDILEHIALEDRKKVVSHFYNRSGRYQVMTKMYTDTISYKDKMFVTYQFSSLGDVDDFLVKRDVRIVFGRTGLELYKYKNLSSKERDIPERVESFDLYYRESGDRNFTKWEPEVEIKRGFKDFKVCIEEKGVEIVVRDIYYVPFTASDDTQYPVWRDFAKHEICFANPGWKNVPDDIDRTSFEKESATKHVDLGDVFDQVQMDIYRPVELREVYQNNKLIEYHSLNEEIRLPFIVIDQFKIRDFDKNGVHEYECKDLQTLHYTFPSFKTLSALSPSVFASSQDVTNMLGKDVSGKIVVYLADANCPIADLYGWDYQKQPNAIDNFNTITEGIEFQSLKYNLSPRHYHTFVTHVEEDDGWGDSSSSQEADCLSCFRVGMEHSVYFFIFEPLRKTAAKEQLIEELIIPLLKERNYDLTNQDIIALYRLAREFHFDWMLLARDKWSEAIASFDIAVQDKAKTAVENFFKNSPKITDEKERFYLSEFLKKYWSFQNPEGDDISTTALNMILGTPFTYKKNLKMEDFLRDYDECMYKFSEMSRVVVITENN